MKASLIFILLGSSLVTAFLSVVGNLRLSKGNKRYRGLIIPSLLALFVYGFSAYAFVKYGIGYGLLTLVILNIPLAASLVTYVAVRLKRYNTLAAEVRARERAKRPTVTTTVAFRALLKDFHYAATTLSETGLQDVIILTKAGTDKEKIATTYNVSAAELVRIEKAFDSYVSRKNEEKKGEACRFTPEQQEIFLQMMTMSTPSSMGCGDSLLWDPDSLAVMIRKATNIKPSPTSVNTFLADCGILPDSEETAIAKTPEGQRWLNYEYNKIRMSALELGATLFWVFAPKSPAGKRGLYLCARDGNGNISFGVYAKTSGFTDFMSKLAQQSGAALLYAVVCTDYSHFKNLDNIHPGVRLFGFGKPAVFSDDAKG